MQFSIKDILKSDSSENEDNKITYVMKWVNLFGCNPDCTGKEADKQNENVEEATCFKGRVLIEYSVIDDKHPVMKIRDIDQNDEYKERLKQMEVKLYHIQAEIGAAICLPDTKDYTLKIMVGEQEYSTGPPKQGKEQGMKNYCRWSQRFSEQFESVHQHLHTFPYVFIYLMDGKKPVCFWKDLCTNYVDPEAKPRWVPFEPDLALGKVTKPHIAGLF